MSASRLLATAIAGVALTAVRLCWATDVEVTFSGTVGSGGQTIDTSGLFGMAGANLVGDRYTATILFDTAAGTTLNSLYQSELSGGALSAGIAINGHAYSFTQPLTFSELIGYNNGFSSSSLVEAGPGNGLGLSESLDLSNASIPSSISTPFSLKVTPSEVASGTNAGFYSGNTPSSLFLTDLSISSLQVSAPEVNRAPEIDTSDAGSALTMLAGLLALIRGRRISRSARQ